MKRASQTNRFLRDVRRMRKRGKDLAKLEDVVRKLAAGMRLDARHKDHPLVGEWVPSRDCHIEPDWILIYTADQDTLRLERTGTHADLFDLTRDERDDLVRRAQSIHARLYPPDGAPRPSGRAASRLRNSYNQILGEYADRLPRVMMGACPFTGTILKRSFDPYGIDGFWWPQDREVEAEEPEPPSTFKVLLGALAFHGRPPSEVRAAVLPGPDVPFVVPRLLGLPGMVAVVSQLDLITGDTAYPISYYSTEDIPAEDLHQFWLRQQLWFEVEGRAGWLIADDAWDFDLQPWIAAGKLRWILPGDESGRVVGVESGEACPYAGLPGDRLPQALAGGERVLDDLPDGTPVDPYEE